MDLSKNRGEKISEEKLEKNPKKARRLGININQKEKKRKKRQ